VLPSLPVLPPARRQRRRGTLVTGLCLAVCAAAWLTPQPRSAGSALPPVPADAAGSPLGAPAAPPEGAGAYGWMVTGIDGGPVRFDPCRPVHWVLRPDGEPPGGREALQRAVAEVAMRTGLRFVEDGATTEAPSDDRAAMQPERYGDRWAPVLLAWSTVEESPRLGGDVAGYAGPVQADDGGQHLVSGQVVLDVEDLAYDGGEVRPFAYFALLHELGHLVGLAHVGDAQELMYPQGHLRAFGTGDLQGLAAAGSGPCSTRDPG
jgi:hypothetical protein